MYNTYVIKENDTLEDIANKTGSSVSEILRLNGINQFSQLQPGMSLVVPRANTMFETYTVKKGDTIFSISKQYNVDSGLLHQINGLDEDEFIYPDQQLLIPQKGVNAYITENGDTLAGVALKMGVTPDDLLKQNQTIYLLPQQLILSKK